MGEQSAAENEAPESQPTEQGAKAETPFTQILILEDSLIIRRTLENILNGAGFSVTSAADGKQGLKVLHQVTPDKLSLIICDIMMPTMDGPTFIEKAIEEYGFELPPIIISSSHADRDTVREVKHLGVKAFIVKPFQTDTVLAKVRANLRL